MFMYFIVKNPPDSLWCTDITTVDVLLNLVSIVFESSTVGSFMNVFKAIFDRTERRNGLNVCMAIIFGGDVCVVRYDPTIVEFDVSDSRDGERVRTPVIRTRVQRVAVFSSRCILLQRFRVTFCAAAIFHARSRSVQIPTGTVNHGRFDGGE